uniref:Uncharacterized protein n=1 Tax=Odontella aurita TaxID=265563 RepID=A0A7S4JJM7_9STRA|mmetsp:Transcript_47512/g.143783  ORF Transcript_47512/g.143783 Transcript_47512/m.143783 type:complete len:156 (+) Transcript_47512:94-561(+)
MLHALGVWVERQLQQVAVIQRSYFESAAILNERLALLPLPPDTRLFKSDAVLLHTNIKMRPALTKIAACLHRNAHLFHNIDVEGLVSALTIDMTNNVFMFVDTFWKDNNGNAMGTPPVPPRVTIFYEIQENFFMINLANRCRHTSASWMMSWKPG